MGISNHFNDEIESAGYDGWKSVFCQSLNNEPEQCWDIFFKLLAKVATENNLSGTYENIFNAGESGIQINDKSDSVIRAKGPKMFMS